MERTIICQSFPSDMIHLIHWKVRKVNIYITEIHMRIISGTFLAFKPKSKRWLQGWGCLRPKHLMLYSRWQQNLTSIICSHCWTRQYQHPHPLRKPSHEDNHNWQLITQDLHSGLMEMVETSSDLGQNYYTANSWGIENTINGKHFCGHYFSDGSVIFSLLSSVISCLCKTSEYLGPHQTSRLETSFWSQMAQINILIFLKHFVRWEGNNILYFLDLSICMKNPWF